MNDYMRLKNYTKAQSAQRIKEKIDNAIEHFKLNNIKTNFKNEKAGHFYVWDKNGKLYNYFAKTGNIVGYYNKGLIAMLRIALLEINPRKKENIK